jgi:hypothetical protein
MLVNGWDPLIILTLQEVIWITTNYNLYLDGFISNYSISIFIVCILSWWGFWYVISTFYGSQYKDKIAHILNSLNSINKMVILYLGIFLLSFFIIYSLMLQSGFGDSRVDALKSARLFQAPMIYSFYLLSFIILFTKKGFWKLTLVIVFFLMLLVSGKSFFIQLLTFLSLYKYKKATDNIPFNGLYLYLFWISIALILGISLNYSANLADMVPIIYNRILNDGDIYTLFYTSVGENNLKIDNLYQYLISPLLGFFDLSSLAIKNFGAQVFSLVVGSDVNQGPNPHLSILFAASNSNPLEVVLIFICLFLVFIWFPLFIFIKNKSVLISVLFLVYIHEFSYSLFVDQGYVLYHLVSLIYVIVLFVLIDTLGRFFLSGFKNNVYKIS